ncbi:hypothetical protein TDB9533_00904 [Thalassocella blandensis]|nr:hypothetical protein TDB9533_00904 [Thalassocella blandensis]
MFSIILLILPVFLLIFLGWLVRRMGWVDGSATRELNKFVVFLALPALLFDIVIRTDWPVVWQSSSFSHFALSFTLITFLVFGFTLWLQAKLGQTLADATIHAVTSAYSNTAYIGYPLLLAVAGEESKPYVLCATIITVCALFAMGIIMVEINRERSQARRRDIIGQALWRVCSMPIVLAPLLATLIVSIDFDVPNALTMPINMLGLSAAPCALVTIGFFLGGRHATATSSPSSKRSTFSFRHFLKRVGQSAQHVTSIARRKSSRKAKSNNELPEKPRRPSNIPGIAAMVASKLFIHPLLIYIVSLYVFTLNSTALLCIVILAALPTGTGPFMLAELYEREASSTSDAILISTLLSPVTLAITLWLIH